MLHVWIDQDLCTGDGLCTDHCPELFVLLEDGISYVCADGEALNDPGGAESMAPVPPEQVLAAYEWRFHHETLRELRDLVEVLGLAG